METETGHKVINRFAVHLDGLEFFTGNGGVDDVPQAGIFFLAGDHVQLVRTGLFGNKAFVNDNLVGHAITGDIAAKVLLRQRGGFYR